LLFKRENSVVEVLVRVERSTLRLLLLQIAWARRGGGLEGSLRRLVGSCARPACERRSQQPAHATTRDSNWSHELVGTDTSHLSIVERVGKESFCLPQCVPERLMTARGPLEWRATGGLGIPSPHAVGVAWPMTSSGRRPSTA